MAILAASLSSALTFELRFRLSSTLWHEFFLVRKGANFIRCYSRDYQSSGPIRYNPKKCSDVKKNQTFSPWKKLETPEVENFPRSVSFKNSFSLNSGKTSWGEPCVKAVNIDDMFEDTDEFIKLEEEGNSESEDVIDGLGFSAENEPCDEDTKWTGKTKQDAEKAAIEALATRAYTAMELQKKLRGKKFAPKVVDEVVADLRKRGVINDYLYAETFSHSRWSTSTWGPRRIKQALHKKGVSNADAEKATKYVFDSDDSEGDHGSNLGMSKQSMDRLFLQASKQWLRGQDVPHDKRKARTIRWLQYRGFNWGVTSSILKKLESQYPP